MTEDRTAKAIRDFEDLNVYQKAYAVSLEVHKASQGLPKAEQFGLAEQMRRSSKGICANIAEGFGKQNVSTAEFKRYLLMAMGSADEMRVWIMYCRDLGYADPEQCTRWAGGYRDIARMLNGLHSKWG